MTTLRISPELYRRAAALIRQMSIDTHRCSFSDFARLAIEQKVLLDEKAQDERRS